MAAMDEGSYDEWDTDDTDEGELDDAELQARFAQGELTTPTPVSCQGERCTKNCSARMLPARPLLRERSFLTSRALFCQGGLRGQSGRVAEEAAPRKKGFSDEAGLLAKHKEIAITSTLKWVELNTVGSPFPEVSASDDFARENAL